MTQAGVDTNIFAWLVGIRLPPVEVFLQILLSTEHWGHMMY